MELPKKAILRNHLKLSKMVDKLIEMDTGNYQGLHFRWLMKNTIGVTLGSDAHELPLQLVHHLK